MTHPEQLPDNLESHQHTWLGALKRLIELEPEPDSKSFWEHELRAMTAMYADLERIKQSPAAVAARVHEDDPGRVISQQQKETALRSGGASASSVKPYSVGLEVSARATQTIKEGLALVVLRPGGVMEDVRTKGARTFSEVETIDCQNGEAGDIFEFDEKWADLLTDAFGQPGTEDWPDYVIVNRYDDLSVVVHASDLTGRSINIEGVWRPQTDEITLEGLSYADGSPRPPTISDVIFINKIEFEHDHEPIEVPLNSAAELRQQVRVVNNGDHNAHHSRLAIADVLRLADIPAPQRAAPRNG